jgi:cell wall assembly regulator SMI1
MPTPVFIGTEEPAVFADLQAIEATYGFVLPVDYKEHILAYNGGWPKDANTFLQVGEGGQQVARVLSDMKSVKHGDTTLERSLRSLRGDLHDDLIPFGTDTGGDLFCLSVGPEDYGAVYYISHEFYKPPKRKQMKQPQQYGIGVSFLATSFTNFLHGLLVREEKDTQS